MEYNKLRITLKRKVRNMARKIETLRSHGVEILRCESLSLGFGDESEGKVIEGCDLPPAVPEKLSSFYLSLCDTALEGALKQLTPVAERTFDGFLAESHGRGAFFRRFNYSFTATAEPISERFWRIWRCVEISRRGNEIFSQKSADIWDMKEGSIISEKRLKRCLKDQKQREEKGDKKKVNDGA